jgi:hypothetical protein
VENEIRNLFRERELIFLTAFCYLDVLHVYPREELELYKQIFNTNATKNGLVEIQRVMDMLYLTIIIMSNTMFRLCVSGNNWVIYQKHLGTNIIGDNTAERGKN